MRQAKSCLRLLSLQLVSVFTVTSASYISLYSVKAMGLVVQKYDCKHYYSSAQLRKSNRSGDSVPNYLVPTPNHAVHYPLHSQRALVTRQSIQRLLSAVTSTQLLQHRFCPFSSARVGSRSLGKGYVDQPTSSNPSAQPSCRFRGRSASSQHLITMTLV